MSKGLEIVELKLKEVKQNKNSTFRIDSEFYLKVYEEVFQTLAKHHTDTIDQVSDWVTQGPNPKFVEVGIPCLTGRNVKAGRVNYEDADWISPEGFNEYSKYKLLKGDILITLKGQGSIGKIGYVFDERDAIFSRDVGIIRTSTISPSYLHIFLICKYGKLLVDRGETGGTGQRTLTTSHLKDNIIVPRFSIESAISELHLKSEHLFCESNIVYQNAEKSLLENLNLSNWNPTKETRTVKSFSESFGRSGRLDAEYYQPKFDELQSIIRETKHKPLRYIAHIKKSIEPGSDAYQTKGIPFVRVSDISKFGITETEHFLDRNQYEIVSLKPKKDTILLSKDGSIGIAYKVEQDLDVITSGALLHLTVSDEDVLPDYLTLVLNSKLTQMQAERDAGGSIIQHWRPDEIKDVLIPLLSTKIQNELTKQVQQAFKLRQDANWLLTIAKQAIEIAIEVNEQTAMKFIKDNGN